MESTDSEEKRTIKKCVVQQFSPADNNNVGGRFVKYSHRKEVCDMDSDAMEIIANGKYSTTWKGVSMIKCCLDLTVYQHILWELKPRTIIEFGTAYGASALWMDDLMSSYGLDYHIYSMDLNTAQRHAAITEHAKNITFLQGNSFKVQETFTPDMLKNLPHPWFIIEDAHRDIYNLWTYLHKYMKQGDYMIMEDTNPHAGNFYPPGYDTVPTHTDDGKLIKFCILDMSKTPHLDLAYNKKLQVDKFMKEHDDHYAVDVKYQDFFGTNCSWNMNSTFIRL